MSKPYSVRKSRDYKPYAIDAGMDTIRPMTQEERQASKQREKANANEEKEKG